MSRKKVTHFAYYEAPHEGDNSEYWSNAICGPECENVIQYKDRVTCKHCLRILKKDKCKLLAMMSEKQPEVRGDEIWRAVIGYEDRYIISNIGRVKSLLNNCILNQYDRGGYPHVGLYINSKRKSQKVHRLVAIAFIDNPENKPFINHKDGTRNNNHVDNLEWVTNQENRQHNIDLKGYEFTQARRKALSNIRERESVPVCCINDKMEFSSINSASSFYNIHHNVIKRVLDKNKKTRGGQMFISISK